MIRSGSTLQFQITKETLQVANLKLVDLGLYPPPTGEEWDFRRLSTSATENDQWPILKCHEFNPSLAELISQGQAKGLYTYRDMRDVYSSHLRISGQKQSFVDVVLWRKHCSTSAKWASTPGILSLRYEDFVQGVVQLVSQTAEYLEINLEPSQIEEIAAKYSMRRQRERVRTLATQSSLVPSEYGPYDPESQLHVDHIATPHGGSWQRLPALKIAAIEAVSARYNRSNGYRPTQNILAQAAAMLLYGPISLWHAIRRKLQTSALAK